MDVTLEPVVMQAIVTTMIGAFLGGVFALLGVVLATWWQARVAKDTYRRALNRETLYVAADMESFLASVKQAAHHANEPTWKPLKDGLVRESRELATQSTRIVTDLALALDDESIEIFNGFSNLAEFAKHTGSLLIEPEGVQQLYQDAAVAEREGTSFSGNCRLQPETIA